MADLTNAPFIHDVGSQNCQRCSAFVGNYEFAMRKSQDISRWIFTD